jgi:predicted dehydrogenase
MSAAIASALPLSKPLPRLGFLGVGWIGRHRMQALLADEAAEVAAVVDTDADCLREACLLAPGAVAASSLDELLARDIDGVVIATPSALHATQAEAVLRTGRAVFCQKPLARNARETERVVDAARRADRLLGVDLSYRHAAAMQAVRALVQAGELGEVYAVDLVFHNAYGPDKAWFRDPVLSGGGCVIDLGIHMVDLALWTLDFPRVQSVQSRRFARGRPIGSLPAPAPVEDHAIAQLDLEGGAAVRLACSWNLPAGCDAVIEASFYGTRASASFRNVDGSFYDFVADRHDGTRRTRLVEPPDAWGGQAILAWTRQLAHSPRFDASIERTVCVARVLDAIYGR